MKGKGLKDLLARATDWRTLMIFGAAVAVVISFSRYCDILHVGALQAYILFPLSFFILSQLIYQKQMWRNKDMWLAAAVFLWTVISLLINSDVIETPLLSGDYQHLCVSLFLCYPLAGALEPEQRKKAFRLLAAINVIGVTLLCCFALYCVIFGITPEVPFACESALILDTYGRLRLFANPNGSGIYCQVAALLCVYLMLPKQAIWKRILESIALVCIVCALALTDSRTAILSFAAGIGMLGYLLVMRMPYREGKRSVRVLLALFCAVVSVALCVGVVAGARKGVGTAIIKAQSKRDAPATVNTESASEPVSAPSITTHGTEASAEIALTVSPDSGSVSESNVTTSPAAQQTFPERAEGRTQVFLSSRGVIWKAILKALPSKDGLLLYGVSTYADIETLEPDFPTECGHGFHNSFLSVLICYGIPGLVVWLVFLVTIYSCAIRVYFTCNANVDFSAKFLMSLLVSGFFVGMMESVLFVDGLPQASHTWLMLVGGLAVTSRMELRNNMNGDKSSMH